MTTPKNQTHTCSRYADATIPTTYGTVRMLVYREQEIEHVAIVHGEVRDGTRVLTRVHSACLTSEVFHSLKCDCREQLALAMQKITQAPQGVVLYLRQEGRGIGLGNKIRAYAKQQQGFDTVDANRQLGFEDDLRRYDIAADMLADLGVKSIALMTNNPQKFDGLVESGVHVTERVPHEITPKDENRAYLETKRDRMGHFMLGAHELGE